MPYTFNQIVRLLQQHPRRVMAALGALMLGTGVTAFGIAPLAPDAADLPVRQVVESIQPATLAPQGLNDTGFVLYRSDVTRRDDSASSLLQRLGVSDSTAANFLRTDKTTQNLFKGLAGKLVSVETTDRQRLQRLSARWLNSDGKNFSRLVIERSGEDGFTSRVETGELTRTQRMTSGTIRSSLFAATDDARLPDSVAAQLADVFSGEIDFRRDLRAGDRFHVVYETLEADGEVLSFGQMLGAEFINDGQSHQVVWFQEPGQKGGYFTLDGQSLRRAFLSSPLAFSRVSSGYGMRFHPITGNQKAHLGVDFAAPTGTAVRAVGDGTVSFAGWKNGYGNFIVIDHRDQKSTAYAHLSRIQVRKGQRVEQGDTIGAVGSTGASTGPHLHFEYQVKGQHQDPLTLARNREGQPVSVAARAEFQRMAQTMRQQLAAAALVVQASAE